MALREARAFCRICLGHCGMKLTVDDETNSIVDIRGDKDHPLTRGYACFKGLQAKESHHDEARLLHPLKRNAEGGYDRIPLEQALDEIATSMAAIGEKYGADAIGTYFGNGASFNSTSFSFQGSFMDAIGSVSRYSAYTIDQSCKTLSFERMGGWAGGNVQIEQSDVIMLIGTNPVLSHQLLGFLASDPSRKLKEHRARGLKVITVDPRRTETSHYSDLAVQPYPGFDSAILASLIRLIIAEGWHDSEFCERYVGASSMARLRESIEPFKDCEVEALSGLQPGDIRRVAEMFARDATQGRAYTGTGPSMAPHSNMTQHLADCLNVVCGRFTRPGDTVISVDMLTPSGPFYAEVIPPPRTSWKAPPSRIRGVGILAGEKTTGTLPDEILTPGPGQIKCLISCGGNITSLMPDQQKAVKAYQSLELTVVVDPYMSNSARLSDYVIPPRAMYERADLPVSAYGFAFFPAPWVQYSPQILDVPKDSELTEEWYFFWALAKRLGKSIQYEGVQLDMETAPTLDELLESRAKHPLAPLDEIKKHPSGKIFYEAQDEVLPPRPDATAQFDVIPDDVAEELSEIAREVRRTAQGHLSNGKNFTHVLSSRRMRNVYNTIGMFLPSTRKRNAYNPAYLNPDDLAQLGLKDGDRIQISSDHGQVVAIVEADPSLRPGVVSMAHGWGKLPAEDADVALHGTSVNMLISTETNVEPINAMPRMSGVPVNIAPTNLWHAA